MQKHRFETDRVGRKIVARLFNVVLKSFIRVAEWLGNITSAFRQKTESQVRISVGRLFFDYTFVCFTR